MFQMSSVSLTNGNYMHILMPDCCFIRLLVGYSFSVAGVFLAGAAERQEGGGSSPLLLCGTAPRCFGGQQERKECKMKKSWMKWTGRQVPWYSHTELSARPGAKVSWS